MVCRIIAISLTLLSTLPTWAQMPGGKERVAVLVKTLEQGNDEERWRALLDLEALGPDAAPATERMIALLHSKNFDVRLASCLALGKVGKAAVPSLVEALNDKEAEVRMLAAWALGSNGDAAASAVGALLRARRVDDPEVYRRATIALGKIAREPQKVLPVLIESILKDNDPAMNEAVNAIGAFGAPALPYLQKKRSADSAAGRLRVIECLIRIGTPALPTLIEALDTDEGAVTQRVATYLDGMGSSNPIVIKGLIRALESRDYQTTVIAHIALGRRGNDAKVAIPKLIDVMFGPDAMNHARSLETFRSLDHDPREELRARVKARDPRIRAIAGFWLIARLGEKETGFNELKEGVHLLEGELQREAAKLLAHRGVKEKVVPILAHYLVKEASSEERFRVMQALCILAPNDDAAMHAIALALRDPAWEMRKDAARFLGDLTPRSRITLPALRAALNDPDERVRAMVRSAITSIEKIKASCIAIAGTCICKCPPSVGSFAGRT